MEEQDAEVVSCVVRARQHKEGFEMMGGRKLVQLWVLASAALMVVGAFGPWIKALGQSVGGTDGSNDGWLVVAVAVLGALAFYAIRKFRGSAILALLGGIAGIAVTAYDRSNIQDR